ncbi:MAG: hypothetical protein Q9227_007388 [Pyrenula ochraceoflavens]
MATLLFGTGYLAYKQHKKHRAKKRLERTKLNTSRYEELERSAREGEYGAPVKVGLVEDERRVEREMTGEGGRERLGGGMRRGVSEELLFGRGTGKKKKSVGEGDSGLGLGLGLGGEDDRRKGSFEEGERERERDGESESEGEAGAGAGAGAEGSRDDPMGWVDEVLKEKELEESRRRVGGGQINGLNTTSTGVGTVS